MPKRGEKITDETVLERLRLAREKANAKRKELAEERKNERLLNDIERKKKSAEVTQKLEDLVTPQAKSKKSKKLPPNPEISSSSSSDSESEEEDVPAIVVKKKKKKKVKAVPTENSSDSEDEHHKRRKEEYVQHRKVFDAQYSRMFSL